MGRKNVVEFVYNCEEDIKKELNEIDKISFFNSMKVINAFHNNKISSSHFEGSTGYGYDDIGRDAIERVYADIFRCEDALVRSQFISGSHALTTTFFGLLRPNDTLLSITGKPYDTMDEVIGIKENNSSLKAFGIKYSQIDLIDDDFNYQEIETYLKENPCKVIEIQRSKGYSTRKSLSLEIIEENYKNLKI